MSKIISSRKGNSFTLKYDSCEVSNEKALSTLIALHWSSNSVTALSTAELSR